MEVELLWPLIQELIQSPEIPEEDWAFLRQNADTLGCPEAVLKAMVSAHLARGASSVEERIVALDTLVEALGREAGQRISFLIEIAQHLNLPIDFVQTLVQVPRAPVLRYLSRLIRSTELLESQELIQNWLNTKANQLQVPEPTVHHLRQLIEATQKKSVNQAIEHYWELLKLLDKQGMPAIELAYLMDMAREARISESLSQGLQEFLRMRHRGQSVLEAIAYLIRNFIHKGAFSAEELPFLESLAQQEGLNSEVVEALIEVEKSIRSANPGTFGAESLIPLLRALIKLGALDEGARRLLVQRGNEVGLSHTQIEVIVDLEQQILEKRAKFPQSIQPLIKVLVENERITDDKLFFLIKKAQELGGTDKVIRSLVQIEIAAQKKSKQERMSITPPTAPPPIPEPTIAPSPPKTPAEEKTSSPPTSPPSAPSSEAAPIEEKKVTQSSISDSTISLAIKTAAFPKGGRFPAMNFEYSSIKVFSLRSEKDIIRRAEIFSKDARINWYALVEYGEREYVLIAKGKPEHHFEEVLGWGVSPTGEVIAVKHRLQGTQRVYLNGEEGRSLDDISSLVLSPNHKHLAYIARKGEEIFVFLDNIGMGPFMQVNNLTFRPNTENDLFFVYQVDKNRWQIRDYLGNLYGEPFPAIDLLGFSPNGERMVSVVLKNRKFHLREGDKLGSPYDLISDISFTENNAHIVYLVRKGLQVGIVWDDELLHLSEGISGVTLSPDSRFVSYIARDKEQNFLCIHKKSFGPYDKVERPFITREQPAVIYPVVIQGKHHIFVNGAPEAGPFDKVVKFSGQVNSYAAIVHKGGEGQAVLRDGKLGTLYSTADQLVWDTKGKNLAYVARRKGGWAGVVWNEMESDQYDFVQHHTFDLEGRALLFFSRRRDGWYAVLNDIPIPESLCKEILTFPAYDAKLRAFVYLYRQGKDIYEGRITLK
ncbi:MAG: hypothetical protein RML92_05640 [Bacteroidia bacterium]|nr:hypothetical protein [Bacteroidia bacterium]